MSEFAWSAAGVVRPPSDTLERSWAKVRPRAMESPPLARRYRLRFLLQEFDLNGPEIVLGRGSDCHITLEDPLVSRRHARIVIANGVAKVEDLASRNGVRVNGRKIKTAWDLANGDRIRIGTQELVFTVGDPRDRRPTRSTGCMRMCDACSTPFPEASPCCPHCGEEVDEPTLTGEIEAPGHSFGFDLVAQILDKAIETGRAKEGERILRRGRAEIDERLAAGTRLDDGQLDRVSGVAVRLSGLSQNTEWVAWALGLHQQHRMLPSAATIDRLEAVAPDLPALAGILAGFLSWAEGAGLDRQSGARFRRLEALTA